MFAQIRQTVIANRHIFSKRNIIIVLLLSLGLTLFCTIYDGIREQEGLALLDGPLRTWIAQNQNAQMTTVMRLITDVSSPIGVSIITLVGAAIYSLRRKDYWRSTLTISAVTLALIMSAIIKTLTARARPTVTDLVDANAAISYSFPSGHTLGTAILVFVLAYFICARTPTLRRFIACALTASATIALVALSRIYLGYHWLTDVTASIGLALIILAVVITVDTYAPKLRRASTSKEA
jgi:undecaprenyl-diphosphatase